MSTTIPFPEFRTKQVLRKQIEGLGWRMTGNTEVVRYSSITSNSRNVCPGSIFFALDGKSFRGKDFVKDALEAGASFVFIDHQYEIELKSILTNEEFRHVFFGTMNLDTIRSTVLHLLDKPSQYMINTGVTGTNGKTTISCGIQYCLNTLHQSALYIGTLGIFLERSRFFTGLTTPPYIDLMNIMAVAHEQGVKHAVIEASSHGLDQGRMRDVFWNLGIFTNLTPEHMDYHRNMDHYYQSKRTLFQELIQNFRENPNQKYGAIINVNDPFGRKLADWMREEEPSFPVWCFGGEKDEIEIVHCNLSLEGYQAKVRILKNEYLINSPVLGRFNAWNHTVILAALLFYGVSSEIALATLENITPVPGRMEVYRKQNKTAVVDYAHTPDALENALNSLKELNPHRLYVIFGCGGDRDREKRPLMGKIATQLADYVTITNDNPRTENPENIFQDICLGITSANFQVVSDRKEAIVKALKGLSDDDVLLIAGKGHEDYQILGSQKIHFSDAELVREFL